MDTAYVRLWEREGGCLIVGLEGRRLEEGGLVCLFLLVLWRGGGGINGTQLLSVCCLRVCQLCMAVSLVSGL